MRKRKFLVADLLCGAGGSSTGCELALRELGLEMELVCLNHWQVAIDTHSINHPKARHICQDIATARPHRIVPEGFLDLLMASPTCTYHSLARGGKPTSDQQRSDPWHIITWLTELRVKRLIIENVWEFINWGPVDPRTGCPIESRKGEYFRAWIDTIRRLGFEPEWRKLNAADFGEATTRQRFILMARSDRRQVLWPVATHAKRDGNAQPADGTLPWRPASEIIDWSIKGKSIFNRSKPLVKNTLARILDGITKSNWPEPFLVILRNHMAGRSLKDPLPTITGGGTHIGLAQPIIFNGRRGNKAKPASSAPLPTLDTKGGVWLAEPFVLSQASGGAARPVSKPLPTAATGGAIALISPYYGSGSGKTCTTVRHPLPACTSKARFGLVIPVTHSDRITRARDVNTEQLPTITTAKRGELALVEGVQDHDILFRMLQEHELAAGMGFDAGDKPYLFTGNKTEQIKQIGNAVSVRKMKACVASLAADTAPKRRQLLSFAEAAE
jgi:DNA (cytosine-5)-methyltransferase 1